MGTNGTPGDRMTRDALIFIRPLLLLYCVVIFISFEPSPVDRSVLGVGMLFAFSALYTTIRYLLDVRRVGLASRWWPLWLTADLLLLWSLLYLTGGVMSRFSVVLVGVVVMYSLEFGLRVGMASAAGAILSLVLLGDTWQLSFNVVARLAALSSFFLLIAWFTGSMSDDERLLRGRLANLAATDDLTGLYNRRHLYDYLDAALDRANRARLPVSLLVIDVDFFKQVNDTYGHLAGDRVLKEVADMMQAAVRGQDRVFRFGGEEFVVILPGASTDSAVVIGERIRAAVSGAAFRLEDGNSITGLTVSVGVVTYPKHASSSRQLLQLADQALYGAKADGKDRVAVGKST